MKTRLATVISEQHKSVSTDKEVTMTLSLNAEKASDFSRSRYSVGGAHRANHPFYGWL